MKPTSIIFLVVAAIFVIAGVITCSVAKDVAVTDGYALFDDTGSSRVEHDFTNDGITKIDLAVKDAEIFIYGGADRSYIEFFNFRDGLYNFSTAGQILVLDEVPDAESILDGFSFSGMRYILRRGSTDKDAVRRVNIYLSSQTDTLKIIAVSAGNCTVTVDKLLNQCDITVTADETATLRAADLRTNCALSVSAKKDADITVRGAALNSFKTDAGKGRIDADQMYFSSLDLTLTEGSADITTAVDLDLCDLDISAGQGTVRIGDREITDRPYLNPSAAPTASIRFDSAKANLTVTAIGE